MRRAFPSLVRAASVALLLAAPPAGAATLNWVNAAGGFAGSAANWNPAQVPTPLDSLVFALGGTFAVTFGTLADSTGAMVVDDGTLTFRFPADQRVGGSFRVGTAAGLLPSLTMESGQAEVGGNVHVGFGPGTDATMTVTGGATDFKLTNPNTLLLVGATNGTGRLEVTGGGRVQSASNVIVGNSTADGVLHLTGESDGTSPRRSKLTVSDPSRYLSIAQSGPGRAEVRDGALLDVAGDLRVAHVNFPSTGVLEVGGLGALDSAEVRVGKDLEIGTGTLGSGRVSVLTGGGVDVLGTTTLGDGSGDDTLTVAVGARFTTGGLVMASASSVIALDGGLLRVHDGPMTLSAPLQVDGVVQPAEVQLTDGATGSIASTSGPGLLVGDTGFGVVRVFSGASLDVPGQNVVIASETGSTGTLEVYGGGALTTDNNVVVGRRGLGELLVREGATLSAGDLRLATQAGGIGFGVFRGAGTTAHLAGLLEASGTAAGGSGSASGVVVDSSAHLWLDAPVDAGDLWPGAALLVAAGGTVHLAGTLENRASILLTDGATSGGALQFTAGGALSGRGDVSSSILSGTDTTGTITATGPLLLGRADAQDGFDFLGALDAGAHAVALRDAGSARVGRVTLAGGSLALPAGGGLLPVGRALTGEGTVHGDLTLAGRAIATGASGLAFSGTLTGTGQGMSGTRFRFLAGGRLAGAGAVSASVLVDSGAVVEPTSDLDLGPPGGGEVVLDGVLRLGPHEMFLDVADSADVGGTVEIAGGALVVAGTEPLAVSPAGTLRGHGIVAADIRLSGALEPGPDARSIQVLALQARPAARVVIELGAHATGDHDTVDVRTAADLRGTLDLRRRPGFVPSPGDSYVVITMFSRTGTFDVVTLDGAPAAGLLDVVYQPDRVVVVTLPGIVDVPAPPPGAATAGALRFAALGSPGRAPSLELALPAEATARVELFDVAGRRLGLLHDGPLGPGRHAFAATAGGPGAGLSFARAEVVGRFGREVRVVRIVRLP